MEIKILGRGDDYVLRRTAEGVFDDPIDASRTREFLRDRRHHLAVAIDQDEVVGFVSAVHYVHPDKEQPELLINEVGVAPSHQRLGLARRMMEAMFAEAQRIGCGEAWVLTEASNAPAMGLYSSLGGTEGPSDVVMFSFSLKGAES